MRRRTLLKSSFVPTLEISPTSVSLGWDGTGSATVNVISNTSWEVVTT